MMRRTILITMAVACLAVAVPVTAADEAAEVFKNSTSEAEVWVSTWLAAHRSSEAYTPLLVVVKNRAQEVVPLDRDSFHLIEKDGTRHPLATVDEIRGNYKKARFDRSMGRFYGLPVGTRLDLGAVVPSNFFPVVTLGAELKDDDISLATNDWMIDLLYFRTPASVLGDPVFLEVRSPGWEEPIRVGIE